MGTAIATNGMAPSMGDGRLQTARFARVNDAIEAVLDRERDQLALWLPVGLGAGIAAWFTLDDAAAWVAWLAVMAAIGAGAALLPRGGRMRRVCLAGAAAGLIGCAIIWIRADWLAAPVLSQPRVAAFAAVVERVEVQSARDRLRLTLRPVGEPTLPPRIRVNVDGAGTAVATGDRIRLRARLVGPQGAPVPGGFDFARIAWFQQLGATGKAIGSVERIAPGAAGAMSTLRERLSGHIRDRLSGSAGGIAAALATGDRGGIAAGDEDAMRASGLTHLLSVSGLHVTAVVGAAVLLSLRLLALSPFLALRLPLLLVSALAGALAGLGYTLLTGAEVPTVRSCIAATLVLAGIALGREAFTLRLVATGAIFVLLLWPESLVGPSFQLSFAAITAIVALHDTRWMRQLADRGDRGLLARLMRALAGLLLTGLAVEMALAPIALFHFHKSGLYGALANIVAIPLTTFVIMPAEALALLFDAVGAGAPFWWATRHSLDLLLWLAHTVAGAPGAQAAVASVPAGAFALMIGGGLWLTLWRTRLRIAGAAPIAIGAIWSLMIPPPDLVITGDGMHMAVRGDDGRLATLRPRAGDYVRSVLAERAGELGELGDLDALRGSTCGADSCRVMLDRGGRTWRVFAIRSRYRLDADTLKRACATADIVVSDRKLPASCRPRWFRADRQLLSATGGLAVTFASTSVESVAATEGAHPWVTARRNANMSERSGGLRPSGARQ